MFGDYSKDLVRRGIIEIKAGNRETARRYLDRAVYMSGDHDVMAEAWYGLSQITDDASEKRRAIENCLANDLQHARARRALAVLDGRLDSDDIIDPDASPPGAAKSQKAEAERFMCPRCGGRMTYAPDGKSLACEYCRRHQAVRTESSKAGGDDFIVAMATRRGHSKPPHESILHCQGCGAEFILGPSRLSATCAFCRSPHVVSLQESKDLMEPDGILPHAFDARYAAGVLRDWIESLTIEAEAKLDSPRGVYLPVWTFALGGGIDYTAEMDRDESQIFGRRLPTPTRVDERHPVMMRVSVAASRRPSAPLVRLLPSFDMAGVVPYDARYLAAWPAELYDVPMAEASLEARSQAYALIKRELTSMVYPARLTSTSSANLAIESFRLDLLPVWTTEVWLEGRERIVLINGQNGAVQGEGFKRSKKTNRGGLAWLADLLGE
jgi:hypothetical protein